MPKFLETILQREYGKHSAIPYKIMNHMGAMHGSKETKKGKAMAKKHAAGHPHKNLGTFLHPKKGRSKPGGY